MTDQQAQMLINELRSIKNAQAQQANSLTHIAAALQRIANKN